MLAPEGHHLVEVVGVVQLDGQPEHCVSVPGVGDAAAAAGLHHPLLDRELEEGGEGVPSLEPRAERRALGPRQLLEEVLQELRGVLLPARAEFRVVPADQRAEHTRGNQQLWVAFVFALLQRWRIAVRVQGVCQLGHLGDEVRGRLRRRFRADLEVRVQISLLGLRQGEQQLHHGVHVARVAEVPQADDAGAPEALQALAVLADRVPVAVQVQVQVQLGHGLVRFLHLHHVDAPMLEVLGEEGVLDHVVLIRRVGVHISTLSGDRPQLHDQGEKIPLRPLFVKVVEGTIATACAIKELPPAADVAVGEIEP
mmetsp:Transcript_38721/g.111916  ORF Transcript_38721/g.111916 Transcript_38721/m.111916 type:complete len:311 (-) Transcript_38721:606-1538(-)